MNGGGWFLYALRCGDDTLYTGVTTDVARRLAEHNSGQGARYTAGRRPVRLIGAWRFADQSRAQRAEARFRRLPRRQKLQRAALRSSYAGSTFCHEETIVQLLNPVRFCPQCGGLLDLTERPGDARPRHGCTVCGRIQYRNSKPCAAVLITHDGRVLLVKRAIDPYRGCWDIPGGFLESDEHPELGALREAKEETGLVVQLTELFGIYMGRYNYEAEEVDSLNIYYLAEISGGTESPGDDATDLAWFAPEALPKVVAFDHAREVLEDWTQRMMTVEQT